MEGGGLRFSHRSTTAVISCHGGLFAFHQSLRFFTPRGLAIIQSEFVWIWLPAILFAAMVLTLRRKSRPDVVGS
jgi:lipopolysaccharide export LptBFGC system permease protein LptF